MKRVAEPMRQTALIVRPPISLRPPESALNMSAANPKIFAVSGRTIVERHRSVGLCMHELVHKRLGGIHYLPGGSLRHNMPARQKVNIVHDLQGFLNIMSNHDRGCAECIVEPADQVADDTD